MRRSAKSRALKFRHSLLGPAVRMKNLNKFYDEAHEKNLRQMLIVITSTYRHNEPGCPFSQVFKLHFKICTLTLK